MSITTKIEAEAEKPLIVFDSRSCSTKRLIMHAVDPLFSYISTTILRKYNRYERSQDNLLPHCLNSKKIICILWILFISIISIICNSCNIRYCNIQSVQQLIVAISKRDEKKKERRNCANCIARRFRYEAHNPVDSYFAAATVANIKYLALIFEYSNLFRERVKITTCPFFFPLAALNYGHRRIVPSEMQIGAHSPCSSWPHFAQILYNL